MRTLGATHDWSQDVDPEHLQRIQRDPERYAPGGVPHLVLEVLAYAVDEAIEGTTTKVCVTRHHDGSFSVADNGRGTEMRYEESGRPRRKPVTATRDLRYFDVAEGAALPDGHPRFGMSVVTALSEWLTHTTRRDGRGWEQRYEHGLPVGLLTETRGDGAPGTTVRFRPGRGLVTPEHVTLSSLGAVCAAAYPFVQLHLVDETAHED